MNVDFSSDIQARCTVLNNDINHTNQELISYLSYDI